MKDQALFDVILPSRTPAIGKIPSSVRLDCMTDSDFSFVAKL
jgi:hypothetical protein